MEMWVSGTKLIVSDPVISSVSTITCRSSASLGQRSVCPRRAGANLRANACRYVLSQERINGGVPDRGTHHHRCAKVRGIPNQSGVMANSRGHDGCLSDSRILLDVSALRVRNDRDDADECLCDFPRVPRLSRIASAQGGRLLRVLFLRFRQMSSHPAVAGLLWKRNPLN
jgi:hypothetical protein